MKGLIADFKKHSFLLSYLITKDFKVKYRRSVLGIAWSVLNPLFMMIIVSLVFSHVFRADIGDYPYPVYLILGQTLFNFLSESTTSAMQSVMQSASLIKKVYIPKYIFPLHKVTFSFVNFAISLIAVVLVMIYYRVAISPVIFLSVLLIALFYCFCLGLGLLLSAVAVFFRDMLHIYSIFLTAWMYFTPVFYTVDQLPETLRTVMNFNPMYHYVTFFRDCVLFAQMPSLSQFAYCIGFSLIMLLVGAFVFVKKQDKFILYI